jgi:hypothetical protein
LLGARQLGPHAGYEPRSTSPDAPHTVNQASTTTSLTGHTPDPSLAGNAITVSWTVTVDAPGAGTPTGNVTVSDGVDSCSEPVGAGTCQLTLTTTGARSLVATYVGDSPFLTSASAGTDHTVN